MVIMQFKANIIPFFRSKFAKSSPRALTQYLTIFTKILPDFSQNLTSPCDQSAQVDLENTDH